MPAFLDPIAARINQSRQFLPFNRFAAFSLGRAALITDNAAAKAALFWPKMTLTPKERIRGTAPDHDPA
jgi:hypothetical protein